MTSLWELVNGILGYALVAIIIGTITSLVAASFTHSIPSRRRSWRVAGIITAVTLFLGMFWAGSYPPKPFAQSTAADNNATSNPACTRASVAVMVRDFVALDANPEGTAGASNADRLWRHSVTCSAHEGLQLDDRTHGLYIDALLFGAADSAYAYYTVKRYRDSRKYLQQYNDFEPGIRRIAQIKGWHEAITKLDGMAPILRALEARLSEKGF